MKMSGKIVSVQIKTKILIFILETGLNKSIFWQFLPKICRIRLISARRWVYLCQNIENMAINSKYGLSSKSGPKKFDFRVFKVSRIRFSFRFSNHFQISFDDKGAFHYTFLNWMVRIQGLGFKSFFSLI